VNYIVSGKRANNISQCSVATHSRVRCGGFYGLLHCKFPEDCEWNNVENCQYLIMLYVENYGLLFLGHDVLCTV